MFLDTSGLFAILSDSDQDHEAACEIYKSARSHVTTNYVLAELIPLGTTRRISRTLTLDFLRALIKEPRLKVVWINRALHLAGMGLLESREDKSYSLTDAVSFVVMRRFRIREALTSDHHFRQEGFVQLLKHR